MNTAKTYQFYAVQRFDNEKAFMSQAKGDEIIIRQEGNMFVFYENGKELLRSIHQTYAGHRIRNGKHKELAKYAGRTFVFFQPREDGAIDALIEKPFYKVRKPINPVRLADFIFVEIVKPEVEKQIVCPVCGSHEHKKNGKHKKTGAQMYKCKPCGKNFAE